MRRTLTLALSLPLVTVLACSELDTTSLETTQHSLSFVPNLPYRSNYALYVSQGWNGSYSHSGNLQYALDFAKSGCKGEQVLAVGDGTVSYRYDECNCEGCSCNGGWGNAIVIDHGNGDYSKYTHLVYQSIPSWIQVGTPVCRGLHIGDIGSTGNSTGPHLHFQFQSGGALNSPSVPFVRFAETSGVPVEGGGLYTSQNAERSSCGPCSVAIDGSVRVIDDQSNCFRRRCITGNYWYEVASGYDNHHWYTYTIDSSQLPSGQDADCRASWEANVTVAGSYLVEAFIPNNSANTSTKVDYSIRHDGVSSVIQDVNQSNLRGQWVSLGTHYFGVGAEQWIEVTDLTGERYVDNNGPRILLDALRFSPVGGCSDECSAGAKRCSGTNGYESCGNFDGDACLEWGGLTSCPASSSCSGAGECVSSCSDECSAGSRRCVSGTDYESCGNFDGDACLEWGGQASCPGACTGAGQCSLPPACSVLIGSGVTVVDDNSDCFSKSCVTGDWWYAMNIGHDGHSWYTYTVDDSGTAPGLDYDCKANWTANVQSASSYLVEVFVPNNPEPLTESVEYEVLHAGQRHRVTVNQAARRGTWVELGSYAFAAGAEQGVSIFDNTGERYVNDAGKRLMVDAVRYSPPSACSDECSVTGARQCVGSTGWQSCGNHDGDPCLEWAAVQACGSAQHCESGACVDDAQSCSSECAAVGLRQCLGDGVQECGDFDDDACLEWGSVTSCPSGFVCELGHCLPDCSSECVSGLRCWEGAVQQCGNFDGDACLEWGADTLCESGFVCSGGQCVADCVDDCVTARCVGSQRQDCGQFDDDPCLDWGEEELCEDGRFCVDDGLCVDDTHVCSDQCESGSRRCEGNVAQSCGDFDGDPCLEWGGELACEAERVCANGLCELRSCEAPCPGMGVRGCWGSDAVALCALDERGCWAWQKEKDCAKGSYCMAPGLCAGDVAGCPQLAVCGARVCGPDPVCQISCGECDGGELCMNGSCIPGPGETLPVEVSGSCSCGLAREAQGLPLGWLLLLSLLWVFRRRGRS